MKPEWRGPDTQVMHEDRSAAAWSGAATGRVYGYS